MDLDESLPPSVYSDGDDLCASLGPSELPLSVGCTYADSGMGLPPTADECEDGHPQSCDSDVDLPPDISEAPPELLDEMATGLDDATEYTVIEDEQDAFLAMWEEECAGPHLAVPAPTPADAIGLDQMPPHDVMEVYSPPRLVPEARKIGLAAPISCDLLAHWGSRAKWCCELQLRLLVTLDVLFSMWTPLHHLHQPPTFMEH